MNLDTWLAFLVASWAISLSPGAGAVASMSSGLRNGLARSGWTIAGLQLGVLVHIALVGLGVGALLATSQTAFEAIRWSGVAYLVYLGVQQWRAKPAETRLDVDATAPESPRTMLLRGFLVNVSNPKAIVFMLAVLPQFVNTAQPLLPQYLAIAATMVVVDVVVMSGYAGLASNVLRLLRDPRQIRWINRTFGALFVGAAAALALFRRGT